MAAVQHIEASRLPAGLAKLLPYLPEGSPLPASVWLTRHRAIVALVWLQSLALALFSLSQGYDLAHSLLDSGAVVLAPAVVEALRIRNRTVRATAASLGLITASAVLTHISGGYIEAHFHFFVMLAVIALYQSWVPFGLSILYVLLHHGIGGLVDAHSVFNHPDAIANPWKWAGIHAGFVSAACVCYIIAWRWNETALAQSKHILNAAGEGIFGLDTEGRILFVNPAGEKLADRPIEELEGASFADLLRTQPDASGDVVQGQAREGLIVSDDLTVPVEFVRTSVVDRGVVTGEVITIRDITARKAAVKALEESERRFRTLVQNAPDLITVISSDTTVRYQSPSIARVLGYDPDALVGKQLVDLLHPADSQAFLSLLGEVLMGNNHPVVAEARLQHSGGAWHDFEIVCTGQPADDGSKGIVLNSRDVSERKALEGQLRHEAFHDSLTDLANRASFFDRMEHALARARRQDSGISVLFIDLDDFKSVNDRFGHEAGDQVLIEVARRLQACIGAGDTAARLGGDEFAVLIEDVTGEMLAEGLGQMIISALKEDFSLGDKNVSVATSIGAANSAESRSTAGEILRNADIAMYEAKRNGGSQVVHYTPDMYAYTLERLELLADLHGALSRNEFEVHYQPTVRLQSGRVSGFEALVRWRHPRHGLILPERFIRLAEDSGVIVPMGRWVLQEACIQARRWQQTYRNDPPLTMSVNVSVHQLHDAAFVDDVKSAIEASAIDPAYLTLEITESAMLQTGGWMNDRLNQLKALGVHLAIDDFGTGYSSLSYLHDFPFDILKVDKAFVQMESDSNAASLARAIIELGKTLKLQIVAEGIEDLDQLERLQLLDCEFGQGYYFSKPMEANDIAAQLDDIAKRAAA